MVVILRNGCTGTGYLYQLYRMVQKIMSKQHVWTCSVMSIKYYIGIGGRKCDCDGKIASQFLCNFYSSWPHTCGLDTTIWTSLYMHNKCPSLPVANNLNILIKHHCNQFNFCTKSLHLPRLYLDCERAATYFGINIRSLW